MKNLQKPTYLFTVALLFCSFLFVTSLSAQDKSDQKIKVKITKENNGDRQVIEKTYNSVEEMKNDPELEKMDVDVSEDGAVFLFKDDEGKKHKRKTLKKSIIITDEEGDEHPAFSFNFNDESITELHGGLDSLIAHLGNENGEIEIMMKHLGKNMEGSFGNTFLKFFDDTANGMEIIIDGKNIDIDSLKKGLHKNLFFHGDNGKIKGLKFDSDVDIEIDEDGKVHKFKSKKGKGDEESSTYKFKSDRRKPYRKRFGNGMKLEDFDVQDFTALDIKEAKPLKFYDLVFTPNNRRVDLKLSTDKKAPVTVKIMNIGGGEVYSQKSENTSGEFHQKIDLSNEKRGNYLLEISQGNRKYRKKIVIE